MLQIAGAVLQIAGLVLQIAGLVLQIAERYHNNAGPANATPRCKHTAPPQHGFGACHARRAAASSVAAASRCSSKNEHQVPRPT